VGSSKLVLLSTHEYVVLQIKDDEMGGIRSMYGKDTYSRWQGKRKEEEELVDLEIGRCVN
jgi:hypothetical protein